MSGCKHINTTGPIAALLHGGRYFDHEAHQWVCPWCTDHESAVELLAALLALVEDMDEGEDDD